MALTNASENKGTVIGGVNKPADYAHAPDPEVAPFTRQMSQLPPDKDGNAGAIPPLDHAPQIFDEVQADGSVVKINADAKPYVKKSPLATTKNVASTKDEAAKSSNNANEDNSNAGTRADLAKG